MRTIFWIAVSLWIGPYLALSAAESPRMANAQVELVSGDFQLTDGPATDGTFALYIPDVQAKMDARHAVWVVLAI